MDGRRVRRIRRRHHGARRTGPDAKVTIYGWHAALAALRNPARAISEMAASEAALRRLREEGMETLPVAPVGDRELARIAGPDAVHQGIALVCDPLPESDLTDFARAQLLLVLDQVTDPRNVGALIRLAAAFGADAVVTADRHAPNESGVLAKAAAGGLEHVPVVRVTNLARALTWLGAEGFERIGLDSEFAEPLAKTAAPPRCAIVLGAEGAGLRRLTREHCDRLVRIDLPGPIASLNVATAGAIALYALAPRNANSPLKRS